MCYFIKINLKLLKVNNLSCRRSEAHANPEGSHKLGGKMQQVHLPANCQKLQNNSSRRFHTEEERVNETDVKKHKGKFLNNVQSSIYLPFGIMIGAAIELRQCQLS